MHWKSVCAGGSSSYIFDRTIYNPKWVIINDGMAQEFYNTISEFAAVS